MFFVGISIFAAHGESAVEKIKHCFELFDENTDRIDVVFELQDGLEDNLGKMFPDLYEEFKPYLDRVCKEEVYIDDIDAYYGEPSEYATMLVNAKKPVMIMTV